MRRRTYSPGLLGLLVGTPRVLPQLDDDLQHSQEELLRRRLGRERAHAGELQLAAAQRALLRSHDDDALCPVEPAPPRSTGRERNDKMCNLAKCDAALYNVVMSPTFQIPRQHDVD